MTGFWVEAEAEAGAEFCAETEFAPISDELRFGVKASVGVGCPDVDGFLRCLSLATGEGEYSLEE